MLLAQYPPQISFELPEHLALHAFDWPYFPYWFPQKHCPPNCAPAYLKPLLVQSATQDSIVPTLVDARSKSRASVSLKQPKYFGIGLIVPAGFCPSIAIMLAIVPSFDEPTITNTVRFFAASCAC